MGFEIEGGWDLSEINPAAVSVFLFLKRENGGIFISRLPHRDTLQTPNRK
jgi:hypothetical protein